MSIEGMKIAVLRGGKSAEREVSLQSGETVIKALRQCGCVVIDVDTATDGWATELQNQDFVFNALHGPGGEDGLMQGMLASLGLPYSGSAVLGSALAMDKARSKQLWAGIGVATGEFECLSAHTDWQAVNQRLGKAFVKPACEGSSIGMSSASSPQELKSAYQLASQHGTEVIAEKFIDGAEYTVAVLGGETLPIIRLETDNDFYDYDAKYISNDTRYLIPSGLTAAEEKEVSELVLRAFNSLGCSVWGRVDVMRDSSGQFFVLEVNTIPGMTSHSLVPMAAAAQGLSIADLVEKIVTLSLEVRTQGGVT